MLDLSGDVLMYRLMMLIPLVLSLTVHEWAHAWSAFKLGDDTASMQGRMTLDPTVHIDPLGTFLLPLLGVPFGWAKPVPVNPARFDRKVSMRTGMMITAAAGPLSNVVLALLTAVGYGLLLRFAPFWVVQNDAVSVLLQTMIVMNIALALFNMIPVPPLDGSRVLDRFVPYRYQHHWENLTRYSPLLLLLVILGGGSLLAVPVSAVKNSIFKLIASVAGYA